jgi:hypothetical protein
MVGNFRRRIGAFALLLTTAWAPLAGCDSGGCQLHSDCNADQQCVQGRCEEACSDDFDCVLGEACVSGACVDAADAVRPRPCDPATSEAGCPDTSSPPDAVVDATPRDAAPVDAVVVDATAIDAGDAGDAASSDGGVETDGGPDTDAVGPDSSVTPSDIDLTGTYAVTRTVDLTNDDAFTEGDVAHFIANLTRLADHTRYRLDFIDPEGHALSSEVALDFRSPEGPYNYQYRYERPIDAPPPGCMAFEETFERGVVDTAVPETTLDGQQILHGQFEGDQCAEADRLTNFTIRWVRIPTPMPGGDAGLGDAGPGDAGPGDAGPGDAAFAPDAVRVVDFGPLPDAFRPDAVVR